MVENERVCRICSQSFSIKKLVCPHCGTHAPKEDIQQIVSADWKPKKWATARLLSWLMFIGVGGMHRIYIGRTTSGLIQFFTFGGLLFWQFWDMHKLADNDLPDIHGFPLKE